jgi:hypothetical protein
MLWKTLRVSAQHPQHYGYDHLSLIRQLP